jgi:hypothetical protein
MRFIQKTVVALLVLVLAVGAVTAAPAVDSETTATNTQSALTDGDSIDSFNASNSVELPTLQASYDSDDVAIEIIDPETGAVIERFENSTTSSDPYFDQTGNDSGTYYFNTTFNESDFAAFPMGAEENKDVKIKLIGNTSADEPPTANFTITLNNTEERAVVYAGDEVTGDSAPTGSAVTAEFNEDVGAWGVDALSSIPGFDTYDTFNVEGESVGVNGSDTDVYVVYASDNASTAFSDALDRGSWWGASDYEEADWVKSYQLSVEDTNYKVFNDEAPDEEPEETYGVTTSVGPSDADAIKVDLGEDAEDETAVDVSSTANDAYGFIAAQGIRLRSWGLSLGLALFVGGTVGIGTRGSEDNADTEA